MRSDELNVQEQQRITWPATSIVARAYLDQLARSNGILPARASGVKAALERADQLRSGKEKNAAALVSQLDGIAAQLEQDAGAASDRDAARLRSLASTLKGRAAKLR